MKLELGFWGDGTTRLAWWDPLRGEDEIILLEKGKKAQRSHGDDDGIEIFEVLDSLSDFLVDLLEEKRGNNH